MKDSAGELETSQRNIKYTKRTMKPLEMEIVQRSWESKEENVPSDEMEREQQNRRGTDGKTGSVEVGSIKESRRYKKRTEESVELESSPVSVELESSPVKEGRN